MLDVNKKPYQTHPSLLPLRMALIAAESVTPAHPACLSHMDTNEQCAIQLIEKVRAGYKKQQFVLTWEDVPSPHGFHASLQEMAVTHA